MKINYVMTCIAKYDIIGFFFPRASVTKMIKQWPEGAKPELK